MDKVEDSDINTGRKRYLNMIQGSCVALVTPMTVEKAIDWDALEQLIEWHVSESTDAVVALGTTGECAVLTGQEYMQVLEFIIRKVNNRVPVIAGTGTNSTRSTMHLTEEASALGADACLLVVPYYNCPGQEGLYQHFLAVADAVNIPQILYNVPGRTVTDLLPETIERLMTHRNIVGIKEASGDMMRARCLMDMTAGEDFSVYSGDDATALDLMLMGGKGVISVVANVAPAQVHAMCAEAFNGNINKAREFDRQLSALNKALFTEANPIPVKWALSKMGKINNSLRLPLTPLDISNQPAVYDALNAAGLAEPNSIEC